LVSFSKLCFEIETAFRKTASNLSEMAASAYDDAPSKSNSISSFLLVPLS
jgi:hypothetical protein